MMTDPIADMLTRIRNAGLAQHSMTSCPSSRMKLAIARVMQQAGFLGDVKVEAKEGHAALVMEIRYQPGGGTLIKGLRRVSRPGRRVYLSADEVDKVRNGLGVAVLSTSRGVLSDEAAREASVGGELVCEVW